MVLEQLLNIDIFGLGVDPLMWIISVIVALTWSDTKKDFALGFIIVYLITFILGISQQLWILVALGLVAGWYVTKK